jgi:hypothetical protein
VRPLNVLLSFPCLVSACPLMITGGTNNLETEEGSRLVGSSSVEANTANRKWLGHLLPERYVIAPRSGETNAFIC